MEMSLLRLFAVSLILVFTQPNGILGQNDRDEAKIAKFGLAPFARRPSLGTSYESVAKIKVGSRKNSYRLGDFISVDVAIYNESTGPIFFLKLDRHASIFFHDSAGKLVPLNSWGIAHYSLSVESFTLISPGNFTFGNFLVVLGCNNQQNKVSWPSLPFVNQGIGCIDIQSRGKYRVVAEVNNNVVIANRQPIKTAVGNLYSEAFFIEIQ